MTDEELVAEIVRTKNALLYGQLYDRFSEVVYNKCYSFVKNREEANDLTQDVFIKLFIKLDSFKGSSKFSKWLFAFTYNLFLDYIHIDIEKEIEKQSIPVEEYDHLLIEPSDYNLFQLGVVKLKLALEMITPEDKVLLLLKYQDDLTIIEIATVLNIEESAIKMRLKRAKARIIEIYNEKL